MKYSIRTLLIGVALLSAIAAVASWYLYRPPPATLDVSYGFTGTFIGGRSDTHTFSAELDIENVSQIPKWDRRNSNPPISANVAMIAAQTYRDQLVAAKQFPNGSTIIETKLIPFDARNGVWFWEIAFQVEQIGNPIEEIAVAVLMDGCVVPHVVRRRTDTGWPTPDQAITPHSSNQTDNQIVKEFIKNLNVDRKFAGQIVKLTGVVENIPAEHDHKKSGLYRHFKSNDGHTLIFWFPHGVPAKMLEGEVRITGKLLGFRDLSDSSESWDGLTLFPGIRATGLGH